ncbi:MAG: PDZ domain-containing protein [Ruminococcaceae bacterium]|nr:PDZ domain-containing protein [Oscillospiraceae bacterium]
MREEEIKGTAPQYEADQPREIVGWYIPGQQEPQEVVSYYVQDRPLPGHRSALGTKTTGKKKRSRKGLWIFLSCLLVLVAVVVGVGIWAGTSEGSWNIPSEDDEASSIVDIFREENTTIPLYSGTAMPRMTCVNPTGAELTARQVYEKVNPSVVTVVAQVGDTGSIGTGVIMTADGFIITNAHVIVGGESCWVALSNGKTYDAQLVGYDSQQDLAVLKAVDAENLPAAEFGNSDLARVGDPVYAIGSPLGLELRNTLTDGIISATGRLVEVDGKEMSVIQTNAALNSGNSGGPLINACGQVIGINTLKMSTTEQMEATVEGLGFAIPTGEACFVVNDLIERGEFIGAPTLGISVLTVTREDGSTYVVVYEVDEGYGAQAAGLQEGDVILQAGGVEIFTTEDLLAVRRNYRVDETLEMTIQRQGESRQVSVLLRAKSVNPS